MNQVVLLGFILKKAVLISKTLLKHFLRSVICVNSLPSVMIYGFVNILVARFCCHLSWKITRNSWKSQKGPGIFSSNFTGHPDTLRKNCPYQELFWSAFSRIRTEYEQIPQNNSEYEHFLRSAVFYRIENGAICMELFLEEKNKKWKHLLDQYHF